MKLGISEVTQNPRYSRYHARWELLAMFLIYVLPDIFSGCLYFFFQTWGIFLSLRVLYSLLGFADFLDVSKWVAPVYLNISRGPSNFT